MRSIKFRTFIILTLIFLIFFSGIGISVLWGVFQLSPFNEEVSSEQLSQLENLFNLNDRAKLIPILDNPQINSESFRDDIKNLNLDILRKDLGKIKIIVQNPVRKTLYSQGHIKIRKEANYFARPIIGFITMKMAADIFSWLDRVMGIYDPLEVDCERDDFYLRIPYLKFEDSIDVLDIQCAFKGISRLRVYKDRNDSSAFIISRSIPIINNNRVSGVLSVISDSQRFEQKLGNAFNVILAPVLISMFLVVLFIYYFKSILTSHANKSWVNAKNIAHNLRNKTNAIKYYVGKDINNLAQAKDVIKNISSVNDKLNELIADTLEVAKAEHTGKTDKKITNKNNDFYFLFELFSKIKDIYISEDIEFIDGNNYKCRGSESKIFEAFSVAIDNAIFWHSGNEKIIIKSEKNKNKEFVNLLVLDRGPGISKSDKQNIFKQNFSKSGSTGIGLYKARLLLRELGGDIDVAGRARGGTCVVFKLKLYN